MHLVWGLHAFGVHVGASCVMSFLDMPAQLKPGFSKSTPVYYHDRMRCLSQMLSSPPMQPSLLQSSTIVSYTLNVILLFAKDEHKKLRDRI